MGDRGGGLHTLIWASTVIWENTCSKKAACGSNVEGEDCAILPRIIKAVARNTCTRGNRERLTQS